MELMYPSVYIHIFNFNFIFTTNELYLLNNEF